MPKMELAGITVEVNSDGFLQEPDKWTEDIARAYAALEGVDELTGEHWKVINYIRSYYADNGVCPAVRRLTRDLDIKLRRVWELFPEGPGESGCKWAGIPGITGCH